MTIERAPRAPRAARVPSAARVPGAARGASSVADTTAPDTTAADTTAADTAAADTTGAEARRASASPAEAQPWFRALADRNTDMVAVTDAAGRLIYANPAAEAALDLAAFQGAWSCPGNAGSPANLLSLVHPLDRRRARAAFLAPPDRAQQPAIFRFRAAARQWRFLEVVATNCLDYPAVGGIVLNARDVTERANLSRALATLAQCNQVLVRAADEASLLSGTCSTIVEAGGYPLAWVGYAQHDQARTVLPVASAGRTSYLDGISLSWGDEPSGHGPTGTSIRTGAVQVLKDTHLSRKFKPWLEGTERHGFRTACGLPLKVGGETLGSLVIYAGEAGAFDPAALDLLSQLAEDLGYGIGRIRDAAALHVSEERFRLLADQAPIGILESEAEGAVSYLNPWVAEIFGRTAESLKGRGWTEAVHPDDRAGFLAQSEAARANKATFGASFRVVRGDGEVRHLRFHGVPRGEHPGGVMTLQDVTEEVRSREELAHQAFHDQLTGLPNRALFLDRLDQELARGRREEASIAVLFLDLDRFKVVNDGLGHEAGDTVLREVGTRFLRAVRAGETAARFSGDEFIFIIRDVYQAADAAAAAQRLLDALEAPVRCAGQDVTLTGSVGIVLPAPGATAAAVLRDADTAMYKAKAAGRDRYEIFDDDLHRRSADLLAMEGELRHTLARRELEVYYQPVLEPGSQRPVGAEALLRWHHPARGLVSPLEFIPVAEESGLIKPIGRFVLDQAIWQVAEWDSDFRAPRIEVMAVNLSARQLDDEGTSAMVTDILERYGIAPGRVSLEVTESAVMTDSVATRRSLRDFKAHGFRVAIDDFGTGYSSLAYLHTLPVTTVKVDRSFVERLGAKDDSTPVVQAIIDLGHAMGLRVVAEGVSAAHLREDVAVMGCELAQGFYWAPPLPVEDFVRWWQEADRTRAVPGLPWGERAGERAAARALKTVIRARSEA